MPASSGSSPAPWTSRSNFREDLTQQHGFLHAAVVAGIADSACGYAAHTLMPAESDVLSVEFKPNLLRPATGSRFLAEARVVRAGRTLTVAAADVSAYGRAEDGDPTLVATMLATMIRQPGPRTTASDKIYYVKSLIEPVPPVLYKSPSPSALSTPCARR